MGYYLQHGNRDVKGKLLFTERPWIARSVRYWLKCCARSICSGQRRGEHESPIRSSQIAIKLHDACRISVQCRTVHRACYHDPEPGDWRDAIDERGRSRDGNAGKCRAEIPCRCRTIPKWRNIHICLRRRCASEDAKIIKFIGQT